MKKILLLTFIFACSSKQSSISSLTPEEFNSKLKNSTNATLIDVRTEDELKDGIIAGAENIVYDDSFADKLSSLPKDAPIFLYCAKGKRSEKAAEIMKQKGFKEIYQLRGGLDSWREAKMPIVLTHQ